MNGAARRTVVVVPARDEQARIGACLRALAAQTVGADAFTVVVVLDACRDRTGAVAAETGQALGLSLRSVVGPGRGAGWARRVGMDAAAALLRSGARAGARPRLIASTDADTSVAADWIERQLAHLDRGAAAVAGLIELDAREAARLPVGVLERRAGAAAARLREVRRRDPTAAHHHCAGASLGVELAAYRRVGGIEPLPALEDAAFERRLLAHGLSVHRAGDVRVSTSARRDGRATRGLAVDLAIAWDAAARGAGGAPVTH